MSKTAVIALGGNAIIRSNERGTIEQQDINVQITLRSLIPFIEEGYNLVITHGNGPQVGNIIMRNDAGEQLYDIAQMPLDICVADSQGGIGYMIERNFRNILQENDIEKDIVSIITQVLVDPKDPAILSPSKRIGKSYSKEDAQLLSEKKGWIFKQSSKSKDGYRRVVASPEPLEIFNKDSIAKLVGSGAIVIAVGGGGIPVSRDEDGILSPQEGVIDKDMASSLLASQIGADELYILTDVPFVYRNFGKADQEELELLTHDQAYEYLKSGQFGEGSMKPKMISALDFVKRGGKKSIITEATKLQNKAFGTKITLQ